MTQRIHKDDTVKIIAGANKGTTGKVLAVLPQQNAALVEGVGVKTRHIKPSQLNPRGGKKDIHESDVEYLESCRKAALFTAEYSGWITVSCARDGKPRGIEDISDEILEKVL